MGASHVSEVHSTHEIAPAKTKRIWVVFWFLLAITSFEFLIAFTKGPLHLPHLLVVTTFVVLTIVKAFYIVAEFMHLGHEVKAMVYSIIVPFAVFVSWFILSMLIEGNYTHDQRIKSKMTTTVFIEKAK
jgi:cytochrome c oxidase subunit IV